MNAILEVIRDAVPFVEVLAFPMHIIAKNVHKWKKIEMVVPKLLTWVLLKLICSMNGKNMDLKSGDLYILYSIKK